MSNVLDHNKEVVSFYYKLQKVVEIQLSKSGQLILLIMLKNTQLPAM